MIGVEGKLRCFSYDLATFIAIREKIVEKITGVILVMIIMIIIIKIITTASKLAITFESIILIILIFRILLISGIYF